MIKKDFSFWEKDSYFNDIDVAVIGSGIVGLNAAIELKTKNKKLKVVVLERGGLSLGASSRNAGFCCYGSAGELLDDLQFHSEDSVFALVERRWKGLQKLRKKLGDKNIDFHNWGGYEVFDSEKEYRICLDKLDYLNSYIGPVIGLKTVYKNASKRIDSLGIKSVIGMILNAGEGQIDTGKMMRALVAKAYEAGVLIINPFDVVDIKDQDDMVVIHERDGNRLKCRKTLICTDGFSKPLLPEIDIEPARTQVLVTKPIEGLKLKGTFHFDKGYYYFRNIGNRILLGGGRNLDFKCESTDQDGLTDLIQNRLVALLQNMIAPYAKPEIEIRWSGILGLGKDKTPIIKAISQNVFCAVRLGGMGVAIGSLVGEEAAEMVKNSL